MGKLIISESEKNRILGLYNLNEETTQTQACPVISQTSTNIKDLQEIITNVKTKYPNEESYAKLNSLINTDQVNFTAQGIPQRISCEISLQLQRTNYQGKNVIIIDTNKSQQLIYIFDSNKKFVAKDYVISGADAQTKNEDILGTAVQSIYASLSQVGFKMDESGKLVNTKDPSIQYNIDYLHKLFTQNKARFLPSGIYSSDGLTQKKGGAGESGEKNQLYLTPDGKDVDLYQAIHGYMLNDKNRQKSMDLATKALGSPTDPSVPDAFYNLFKDSGFKSKVSYGCINVSERFVEYLSTYGENSVILNLSEDEGNYFVSNGQNFLQKSSGESCPSPESLGAEQFNVA
jgi:hypothetical protein